MASLYEYTVKDGSKRYAGVIWVTDAATGKKKQRTVTGRTRKERDQKLASLVVAVARNEFIEPTKTTLGQFLEEWVGALERRPGTLHAYAYCISHHIAPRVGGLRLTDVTPAKVSGLYQALRAAGIGAPTVRFAHAVLNHALNDAMKWGLILRNPCTLVERPRGAERKEMKTWTPAQLRRFLTATADDPWHCAFAILAGCGLRKGEAMGLRWGDLDLNAGRLAVQRALVQVGGRQLISEPKTSRSRRVVDLDDRTITAIVAHRVRMNDLRRSLSLGPVSESDYLFTGIDGSEPRVNQFDSSFAKWVKRLGLPYLSPHGLRHSHASLALQAGVPAKVVQERLGHATIAMTLDIYSHVAPGMQAAAAQQISDLVYAANAGEPQG